MDRVQAPHVICDRGRYHMFYGDWNNICHAVSDDGKTFQRVIQPSGSGGAARDLLYVAIVDSKTDAELVRFGSSHDSNQLQPQLIQTGHALGRRVYLRIVDKSRDGWGHINFGGLYTAEP